ncbi:MAG: VCBS domain-containing protein, partial [Anderseniella sp.]
MSIDGDGNDNILDGTSGDDTINGFAGDDTINGNAGNDTINGGADNDWIDGGLGDDVIDAGDGDDYVIYDANDTTLALGGAGTGDVLVYNDGEYEERDVALQGFEYSAERYADGTDDVYDVYDLAFNYVEERRFHNDGTYTLTVFDYDDSETWSEWIRIFDASGNQTYEEFVDDDNGGGGNPNTAPEDYAPVTEDLVLTVTGNLFTDDLVNNPGGVYVLTEVAGVTVPGTGSVFIVGTYGTLEVFADGNYSYVLDNSLVQDFTADDIIPDTFAYNFTEDGFGLNTDLIIEITGNNDAPIASDNTAYVQENITLSATGNVITDDDGFGIDSDVENQPIGIIEVNSVALNPTGTTQITGTFGTLTIDGVTGDYTYDLDNNLPAVQALDFGDTLVDSFTYSLTDGSIVTTADLDVTVEGSDTSVQTFADANSTTE